MRERVRPSLSLLPFACAPRSLLLFDAPNNNDDDDDDNDNNNNNNNNNNKDDDDNNNNNNNKNNNNPHTRTHLRARTQPPPQQQGHPLDIVRAMAAELKEGFVLLGAVGSFTASVGNLDVSPKYQQAETIPVCPLLIPDQCL